MVFVGYTIDTPVSTLCIAQDGHENLANQITYGDGIMFCSYMKVIGGKQQIFIAYSTDEGETWTPEQVPTTTYDHYSSSCAVDTAGTGLHLVYSAKGYGTTANQKARKSIIYQYRNALGIWSEPLVIHQCIDYATTVGSYAQPSIAIDSSGNIHLVCSYCWNSGLSGYWWWIDYIILYPSIGASSDHAVFRYCDYGNPISSRPTIHVDSYCNPHVTFVCKAPNRTYNERCYTTVWIANTQQGALAGWPGTRGSGSNYYMCFGQIYDTGTPPYADLRRILCDKSKARGQGGIYDANEASMYHGVSTSHTDGYYDDVMGYDHPHCVYNYAKLGYLDTGTQGTYYKWSDSTGWHDELLEAGYVPPGNNSIALGPAGVIHTIAPTTTYFKYNYRQRATPAAAWDSAVAVNSIYYPQQVGHIHPVQFPLADALCSPFMAVQGSALKYFKCVAGGDNYAYFM